MRYNGRKIDMSVVPNFDLQRTIRRWDIRRRLTESVIWTPRGLMVGVLIGLIVALISRTRPWLIRDEVIMVTAVASAIGLGIVLLVIWLYPRSLIWLARYFDRRFELKERVSTALELLTGRIPPAEDLAEYQFQDTGKVIEKVNPAQYLPIQIRWMEWIGLVASAIILFLLLRMENSYADQVLNRRELDQALAEQVEELEAQREEILSNQELSEAEQQQLVEPLDEAIETLQEPEVSREEAVAALSEAEQELREQADGFSEEQEQAFESAGERLTEAEPTPAEEAGEALSEGNLEEAANQLEELGEDIANGQLSPEEQQALADQLEQAADALEETNPAAAQALRDAAQALRNGDMEAAQEALEKAADALRDQQQQAQNTPQAQSAQQAADQAQQSAQEVASANQPQQGQPSDQSQDGSSQNQQQGNQAQNQQGGDQPGQQGQIGQQGQPQEGQNAQGEQSQQGQFAQAGSQTSEGGQDSNGSGIPVDTDGASSQESNGTAAGDTPGGQGSDTTTGESSSQGITTNNNPDQGNDATIQQFDSVYAPSGRITGQENPTSVDGTPQGDNFIDEREADFNEAFEGDSRITYDQVYADYANSVNEALDTDYIPIGLKDVIRSYFSSLEP
jgi:hypothetical protein